MSGPITWRIEKRKLADLIEADYNPRVISEQEKRDLQESIHKFGQVGPLVINIGKRNNILIGGHQRKSIYVEEGFVEVEVMVPNRELTKKEEKELNLRLNKNTGSWDFEKLKEMDLTLLLEVGFGDEDLQALFDDVDVIDDDFDVNRAIKEVKEPRTKSGELWQLGDHRIMCGEPLDPDQMAVLMKEDTAHMAYIELDRGATIIDINSSLKISTQFGKPNHHLLFWIEDKNLGAVQAQMRKNKYEDRRLCTAIRRGLVLTAKTAFNQICEHAVYATLGKPELNGAYKGLVEILNKEITGGNQVQEEISELLDLWVTKERGIPGDTNKSVTLHEKPLKRCTTPGAVVLAIGDHPGSVLIACEQIKRRTRVMESDPVSVTVIIDRWEKFTNLKAKRI